MRMIIDGHTLYAHAKWALFITSLIHYTMNTQIINVYVFIS